MRKDPLHKRKMSSKSNFQELQFSSEVSESRKKVDAVNPQHLQNHEGRLIPSQRDASDYDESDCILRKSLAWDNAFFTSPGVLDPEELHETLSIQIVDGRVDITGSREPRPLPSQAAGPETASRNGECGIRRSLAWDSAFFTSAGVLDAEELSLINRGFTPSETHLLPGIKEVWRSAESNSTVKSEAYSLESLEIHLFDNIRASTQKAHDASSYRATSTSKMRREKKMQSIYTSKISDASSQGVPNRGSTWSLKPPKISGRGNPPPAAPPNKSVSLSANHIEKRSKSGKAASERKKTGPKRNSLRDSCSGIPSSTSSVKSPSSVLSYAANEIAPFGCAASSFTSKSAPNLTRRTVSSQMAISVSTTGTPLKHSARSKNESVHASDSICLLSTPKSSSSTSPASSIDWCSSESSSVSLGKNSKNSTAVHVTTACRGISFGNDSYQESDKERHHCDQPYFGNECQEKREMNPQHNLVSVGSDLAPASAPKNPRASCLRMPSPKIGFFDEESSIDIALNGGLKFRPGVQCISPKTRNGFTNTNVAANRTRYGKNQLAGISPGTVNKVATKERDCLKERKQAGKNHEAVSKPGIETNAQRLDEDNKENISGLENQVDGLSRRMEAIEFKRNLVA